MTNLYGQQTDEQIHLSVCICTFRRASIADAIDSVVAQKATCKVPFEIVIADDDPEGSARKIVEEKARDSDVPIRYLLSGARNIARSRNHCLDGSHAPWIAFIDDDEIAAHDWLNELLAARDKFAADGVKGFVQALYPDTTPNWVRHGDPFTSDYGPTGSNVKLGATGNVLISRSKVETAGIRFDPELGRTGGEDLDFFERLKASDFVLVSSRTAVVFETLPESRVTVPFLSRRSRRFGHIDGRIIVARRSPIGRGWVIAKSLVAVTICSSYPIMRLVHDRLAWKTFGRFWYHLGVLEWAAGRTSLLHE